MGKELDRILSLEVPIVVVLGEKTMSLGEVMAMRPGMILELPKTAEDELELLVNNKQIGTGTAVKVGENFGLRISFIGDVKQRIQALGAADKHPATEDEAELEALAAAMLAGQI